MNHFLSVAAHELRNPVTAIRGYAQLLMREVRRSDSVSSQRVLDRLETIHATTDRLAFLVTQLLETGRIETGRFQLDKRTSDVAQVVAKSVEAMKARTDTHLFDLALEPVEVEADAPRLDQVVTNLIDNAIKYSPEGSRVRVSVERGPGTVRIAVSDRGDGVTPEHRERIWERGYQVDHERSAGGMGLGLYLSRQIVEAHGGVLTAEYPTEGGSRFVAELPA